MDQVHNLIQTILAGQTHIMNLAHLQLRIAIAIIVCQTAILVLTLWQVLKQHRVNRQLLDWQRHATDALKLANESLDTGVKLDQNFHARLTVIEQRLGIVNLPASDAPPAKESIH